MSLINVVPAGGRDFDVEVVEETPTGTPGRAFRYHVTVDDPVPAALGIAGGDPAALGALVRESFAFLLSREPAHMILRRFELSVISTYFPEYPQAIESRLRD